MQGAALNIPGAMILQGGSLDSKTCTLGNVHRACRDGKEAREKPYNQAFSTTNPPAETLQPNILNSQPQTLQPQPQTPNLP
jgi:hypothetical protein